MPMNFRFRGKSGRAADITAMTDFDPKETLAALAPEDKADPRVDEVYLSGERQPGHRHQGP